MAENLFVEDDSDHDSITTQSTAVSDEGLYDVEAVLAKRLVPDSDPPSYEYLIKWTTYPLDKASWEVEDCFQDDAILAKFRKQEKEIEAGRAEPYDVQQWYSACQEAQLKQADRHRRRKEKRRRKGMDVSPDESEDQGQGDATSPEEGEVSRPSTSDSIPLATLAAKARADSIDSDAPLANRFKKAPTTADFAFSATSDVTFQGNNATAASSPSLPSSGAVTPLVRPKARRNPTKAKASVFIPKKKPYFNLQHQNNAKKRAQIEPPPDLNALIMVDPATGKTQPPPAQPPAIPKPQPAPPEPRELFPEVARRSAAGGNDQGRQVVRAPRAPFERKDPQEYLTPWDAGDPPDPYLRRNWLCFFWVRGGCKHSDHSCWFAHGPAFFPAVPPNVFNQAKVSKAREIAEARRARYEVQNQPPAAPPAPRAPSPIAPAPPKPVMTISQWAESMDLKEGELFPEGATRNGCRCVFVWMTEARAEDTPRLIEWLESLRCNIYRNTQEGDWEHFRDKLKCYRVLIMDPEVKFYDIPLYRKYLAHKINGNVFLWGFQSMVHWQRDLPERFALERIHARGEVILLTPETMIYHPTKASEVVRAVIAKGKDPAYRLYCRPGVKPWLEQIVFDTDHPERNPLHLLHGQLYGDIMDLCPFDDDVIVLGDLNQEPLEDSQLISTRGSIYAHMEEHQGDKWWSRSEAASRKEPPEVDDNPETAHTLMAHFAGWCWLEGTAHHRYFTVCHMEKHDKMETVMDEQGRYKSVPVSDPYGWAKEFTHIAVERPDELLARWKRDNLPEGEARRR